MCGVIFATDRLKSSDVIENRVNIAVKLMHHRGPDDYGIWSDKGVFVAHRRLSIIDLAASRQPMISSDGRYILSFNGEIYNYKELRKKLEDRWNFSTNGDTEVLLAGIALCGTGFLDDMEGMWSFLLWDNFKKRLLLCRDRLGKKPLYYSKFGGGIFCASELPALLSIINCQVEEDLDSTTDYLKYGYYLPGYTAYKNIFEILPGHYAFWDEGGSFIEKQYWKLECNKFKGSKSAAIELLNDIFEESIKKRMVSDVEVGAFLSGGVDSSLLVSVLCKRLKYNIKTFTIKFSDERYDESRYARIVAKECQTQHFEELLECFNQDALLQLIFDHIGQPFADSSILPTSLVSQLAASKVKVVLSGDGGDELFSGYQRYQARSLMRWYSRLPFQFRKAIRSGVRSLPEPFAHHSRSLVKKAHLFLDIESRFDFENPYIAPTLYDRTQFEQLAPEIAECGHSDRCIPDECGLDDIHKMMLSDALIYLPQDILVKVDRASMAHSIESRAPFLDRSLVEFAFSLPIHWHRNICRGKLMLKESFSELVPKEIWSRRKQGFAVPINEWFRNDLLQSFYDLIATEQSLLNKTYIDSLLLEHTNKQRDHGYRLWSIYIYLLWKENLKNIEF